MANSRPLDEKDLLRKLRDGNHTAFTEIYDRYKIKLTKSLLRILKQPELVEEVIQDLFLSVWVNRRYIDPERSFNAYLYQAAANGAKNIFRKAARDKRIKDQLMSISSSGHNPIDDQILEQENTELLKSILDGLPPQQKLVYTLCKLEGKSYREVSLLLNITEGTVNNHIRNANLFLKKQLAGKSGLIASILLAISSVN